jgi:short-subunit dehydrogenase
MSEKTAYALVTGASSGIGLAISKDLAGRGYPLLMVSNEEENLNRAAAEIQAVFHVSTAPLYMDLALSGAAQKLYDYCAVNNISVEILVNNAGIFFFKDIVKTDPQRIEAMLNLHVQTPAMLCRLFAERMIRENKKSYILNIASITSQMMMPGITLYSSTKSFLRCFSRSMRNEVYDQGVSITTIRPGAAATNLYNLPPRYMKLGVRLGVIIKPDRLARIAVKKMFRRKAEFIPDGFINRLFILLANVIPEALVRRVKKAVRY